MKPNMTVCDLHNSLQLRWSSITNTTITHTTRKTKQNEFVRWHVESLTKDWIVKTIILFIFPHILFLHITIGIIRTWIDSHPEGIETCLGCICMRSAIAIYFSRINAAFFRLSSVYSFHTWAIPYLLTRSLQQPFHLCHSFMPLKLRMICWRAGCLNTGLVLIRKIGWQKNRSRWGIGFLHMTVDKTWELRWLFEDGVKGLDSS